jgi:hypothetical protein
MQRALERLSEFYCLWLVVGQGVFFGRERVWSGVSQIERTCASTNTWEHESHASPNILTRTTQRGVKIASNRNEGSERKSATRLS